MNKDDDIHFCQRCPDVLRERGERGEHVTVFGSTHLFLCRNCQERLVSDLADDPTIRHSYMRAAGLRPGKKDTDELSN
jgi:hypothetical protein